jgi:glycosyltransferase involved in cell wall biosynthesis
MKIISAHKYYYDRDGASRYQLEVNRLLEENGHTVVPFAMNLPENIKTSWSKFFVSPVQTQNVSLGLGGLKTFFRMLYGWESRDKMSSLVKEFSPDVAHVHNIYTQISPSVLDALGEAGVPVVMTVHDYHLVSPNYMMWHDGRIENLRARGVACATLSRFHKNSYTASFAQASVFHLHKFLRLYDRNISKFVCPSEFVRTQMIKAGYSERKTLTLPHFIDLKGKTPCSGGDGSVLFVGRFVEEKGTLFVLELAKKISSVKFVLIGDGPLMADVRSRAREMKNVEVVGWVERNGLAEYYKKASVVLVPSLWHEVFGLVALEAMAYGKPVIASDRGGLPEVVVDGDTGIICAAGNIEMWADAISNLLNDESVATTLGANGRARAEKFYSPFEHVKKLEEIFTHVLKSLDA